MRLADCPTVGIGGPDLADESGWSALAFGPVGVQVLDARSVLPDRAVVGLVLASRPTPPIIDVLDLVDNRALACEPSFWGLNSRRHRPVILFDSLA